MLVVVGLILLLIGVLLVVLPVVPGFPLVIVGVVMLATGSVRARRFMNSLERRLPSGVRAQLRHHLRQRETKPAMAAEAPRSPPPRTPDAGAGAEPLPLDPVDAAWLARRTPTAPIVIGVISIVTSPILLGLLFGPLGLRSGIDLWRTGVRRAGTVVAIAASLLGIVLSVTAAVTWAALLAGVLLGRDAIRAAEGWRAQPLARMTVDALHGNARTPVDLSRLKPGARRQAMLFVEAGADPCRDALRSLADAARAHADVPIIVVDRTGRAEDLRAFATAAAGPGAEAFYYVAPLSSPPAPLEALAALPTLVIVGADGRIEKALVGAHPTSDVEKLLRGDAALAADAEHR